MPDAAGPDAWIAIAGMAAVTYALRAGGLLLGDHLPTSGRWARALDRLPALLLIAIVAPGVLAAGWLGAAAAAVTAAIAIASASGNPFVAMGGGVAVVAIGRQLLAGL